MLAKLTFLFTIVLFPTLLGAQVNPATLQAVFLYQSIKYLEWPSDQLENFQIVVVGSTEIHAELQKIAKTRKVGARQIIVRHIEAITDIPECHIVVVPQLNTRTQGVVPLLAEKPVMLVTADDGLLDRGSDLNFIKKGDKLSFQLNNSRLRSKKIKVSSSFLSMADKAI